MTTVATPEALAQLIARLGELRPDSPRRWGTMTPGEMLCHLGDAAALILGRAGSGSGAGRSRPLVKWIALYSPVPWPRGAKTAPQINPRVAGSKPGDFEKDRDRAVEGLRALASAPATAFPSTHAFFGAMTARDWQRWAYRHTDHHLRQFGL
jgi:hypothetical protein